MRWQSDLFLYQPRNSRAQPKNIWKLFVNACGTKKEMTALRISLKTTRNIDNVGRKFQKIVVYRLVIPWIKFWIWFMASRLWRERLKVSWRKWKKNLHIRNSEFLLAFYTNLIQLNRTFLKLPVLQFQMRHTSDSLGK